MTALEGYEMPPPAAGPVGIREAEHCRNVAGEVDQDRAILFRRANWSASWVATTVVPVPPLAAQQAITMVS